MITGIGHLAFRVTDLERALVFYCGKLGFRDAFRLEREGEPSPWIVYLQLAPGQFVELFPQGEGSVAPAAPGPPYVPPAPLPCSTGPDVQDDRFLAWVECPRPSRRAASSARHGNGGSPSATLGAPKMSSRSFATNSVDDLWRRAEVILGTRRFNRLVREHRQGRPIRSHRLIEQLIALADARAGHLTRMRG